MERKQFSVWLTRIGDGKQRDVWRETGKIERREYSNSIGANSQVKEREGWDSIEIGALTGW